MANTKKKYKLEIRYGESGMPSGLPKDIPEFHDDFKSLRAAGRKLIERGTEPRHLFFENLRRHERRQLFRRAHVA